MGKREEEEVHAAARSGDLKAVQSILSTNPLLINSRDKHSRTPFVRRLHLAAWAGQSEVVSYLCKQKADVRAAAMDDMGAIHFASQKGHLAVVKTLISSGASVNALTRKSLTPLHYAVQGSHLELVKYLVRKGASLTAKTKAGKTPVNLACSEEIHSFLEEWEQSSKKENLNGMRKAKESDLKQKAKESDLKHFSTEKPENACVEASTCNPDKMGEEGLVRNSGVEASASSLDEERVESLKRKSDEHDTKEALSEQKKGKIVPKHLISLDDTQDEEEN